MRQLIRIALLCLSATISTHVLAGDGSSADTPMFEKIFSDWTDAFNAREADKTCQLFSKSVTASYQSAPEKNYDTICNNFKKIFAQTERKYQYSYKIHDVYRSQSLAAVRITWYLQEYVQDKMVSLTLDEGLYVFQQTSDGQWQIVNYVAFPVKHA